MTFLSTEQGAAPADAPPLVRRRLFLVALYALRALATLHALLAVSQAVSIGQYFGGTYSMIRLHAIGAGITILAGAATGLLAVLFALAGGRLWVAVVCPLFFFAEGLQTGMGYARSLGIHVPLGVAIITLALFVAGWVWTRTASRPRIARPRRVPTEDVL